MDRVECPIVQSCFSIRINAPDLSCRKGLANVPRMSGVARGKTRSTGLRAATSVLLFALLLAACGGNRRAHAPKQSDIEKAVRSTWEKPGDSFSPRTSVEFNEIRIGKTYPATASDALEGIPPDSQVTAALVDFTERTYYTNTTRAVRRARETRVFRDKFGEWTVMLGQPRKDESWEEPAKK